jgi:Protein of unknown function (DUF1236)
MKGSFVAVFATLAAATPACAQAPNAPTGIESTGSVPLSVEKQLEIKTSLARANQASRGGLPKVDQTFTPGAVVPDRIDLITLPEDAVSAAPSTTSYRFVLTTTGIAVVDPSTRRVIQVIE